MRFSFKKTAGTNVVLSDQMN